MTEDASMIDLSSFKAPVGRNGSKATQLKAAE